MGVWAGWVAEELLDAGVDQPLLVAGQGEVLLDGDVDLAEDVVGHLWRGWPSGSQVYVRGGPADVLAGAETLDQLLLVGGEGVGPEVGDTPPAGEDRFGVGQVECVSARVRASRYSRRNWSASGGDRAAWMAWPERWMVVVVTAMTEVCQIDHIGRGAATAT
jgi:hypothetical protein